MTEEQYIETLVQQNAYLILTITLIVAITQLAGKWQVFKKANKPGWACLIPFYSSYVSYEIFWGSGWLFLVAEIFTVVTNCSGTYPALNLASFIGLLIVEVMHSNRIARAFGKSAWYTVGLVLVQPIFMCILGFGRSQYLGVPEE